MWVDTQFVTGNSMHNIWARISDVGILRGKVQIGYWYATSLNVNDPDSISNTLSIYAFLTRLSTHVLVGTDLNKWKIQKGSKLECGIGIIIYLNYTS